MHMNSDGDTVSEKMLFLTAEYCFSVSNPIYLIFFEEMKNV